MKKRGGVPNRIWGKEGLLSLYTLEHRQQDLVHNPVHPPFRERIVRLRRPTDNTAPMMDNALVTMTEQLMEEDVGN
jgi:hypothetical protein